MLVGDEPPTPFFAQANGEPQALVGVLLELTRAPTAQKRVRKGDVGARRDVKRHELEDGALFEPAEELRPRLAVLVDSSCAVLRGRHVEHDHVVRVVGEYAVQVAFLNGVHPPLDQSSDLRLVVHGDRNCAGARGASSGPIRTDAQPADLTACT